MHETALYRLQFFRQWGGDTGIEDVSAAGSLDQAKAVAQTTLETLVRERSGQGRPRLARIVDAETREILSEYRLTQGGPVEIARGPATTKAAPAQVINPRLRLVDGPGPTGS